jgi:ubiquinone/menaquinone biosynthesis C-methylase UbiE
MELVVGGQYQQIGILESSALVTLGLLPDHTLVDVGCGSGRLAFHLKSYLSGKYIGTDILEASLRFASEKCGRDDWEFIQNHLPTIPVGDQTADFVTFFSVMTHLLDEDIYKFLQEAKRVTKPGARIVFSFLDYECEQHWPIFVQTVADSRPERVINKFVAREAIRRWARTLSLTEERIYDGYEQWIKLREPFTYVDGRRAEGVVEFGQSVAVLKNVLPFAPTFDPRHIRDGCDAQGNDVYELTDEAGVKVRWSVPAGGKSTDVIPGTVRKDVIREF